MNGQDNSTGGARLAPLPPRAADASRPRPFRAILARRVAAAHPRGPAGAAKDSREQPPAPAASPHPAAAPPAAGMHRVTLSFSDARLEARFRETFCRENLWGARLGMLTGVVALLLLYAATLASTDRAYWPTLHLIPLVAAPLALSLAIFTTRPDYHRHMQFSIGAMVVIVNACWCFLIVRNLPPSMTPYVGANVVGTILVFCYVLLKLRFFNSMLTAGLISLTYLVSAAPSLGVADAGGPLADNLLHVDWTDPLRGPLVYQVLQFLIGNVVGASASYGLEKLSRTSFLRLVGEERQRQLLEQEQKRSEALLLNILPASVARQLKTEAVTRADYHASVTVLFADIVDFSRLSATLAPQDLVGMLNGIFSEFDRIAARYGVEKIKTVGDAYMVAAGIPEPRANHCRAMADCALEFLRASQSFATPDGRPIALRLGLNTGPVVAGVIGAHKFAYDLWGDTVNMAARMESYGLSGRIQVTEAVRRQLADSHVFEPRGGIEIKGQDKLETWWLLGRRDDPA